MVINRLPLKTVEKDITFASPRLAGYFYLKLVYAPELFEA